MNIETRMKFEPVKVEARAEGEPAKIMGRAAVYYDGRAETQYELAPNVVERILPGAFDAAVARDDVRVLFNHDPNMILGRTTAGTARLSVDGSGLNYEVDPGDTTVSRDVQTYLKRGEVSGSSFRFVVTDERWVKENGVRVRQIQGVRLMDVGPVTFPAYTATTSSARGEGGDDIARLIRESEQAEASEYDRTQYMRARLTLAEKLA